VPNLLFRIKGHKTNAQIQKFARELKNRMQVVRRRLVNTLASQTLDIVKENLPDTGILKELKEALVVRDIKDLEQYEAASAVIPKTSETIRRVKDLPEKRTILIINLNEGY